MLNLLQFRELIVRNTINDIGLWSLSAENLLVGTALCESDLTYLKQFPYGPAVSVFQIEPATYDYLRERLITRNKRFLQPVLNALKMSLLPIDSDYLIGNLTAACIFARLQYYFIPAKLPDPSDLLSLGEYYKKYYNTEKGKGSAEKFVELYKKHLH